MHVFGFTGVYSNFDPKFDIALRKTEKPSPIDDEHITYNDNPGLMKDEV